MGLRVKMFICHRNVGYDYDVAIAVRNIKTLTSMM